MKLSASVLATGFSLLSSLAFGLQDTPNKKGSNVDVRYELIPFTRWMLIVLFNITLCTAEPCERDETQWIAEG